MPEIKYTLDHFDGRTTAPCSDAPDAKEVCEGLALKLRVAAMEAGLVDREATDEQIGKAVRSWLSLRRNKTPSAAGWSPVSKVIEWLAIIRKPAGEQATRSGPPQKHLDELPRLLGKLWTYLWEHPNANFDELRSLWDEGVTDDTILQNVQRLDGQLHHLAANTYSVEASGKFVKFTRRGI